MRKISSALFMMVAAMATIMLSLSGCSSDDDKQTDSKPLIVGKWQYVSSIPGTEEGDEFVSEEMEFKADGSFVGFYDNNDTPTPAKWIQKDENSVTVTVDIFPAPMTWPIVSLDQNTLVLKMTDYDTWDGEWSGGTTYTVTFKRIK